MARPSDNRLVQEPERVADLEEWGTLGAAWGNGWLSEVAGRTQSVQQHLRSETFGFVKGNR